MRPLAFRALRWALLAGATALAVGIVRPEQRPLVVDAYVLFAGALAMLVLVTVTRAAVPAGDRSAFDAAREARPRARPRPADLRNLEREVLLASANAFDLHYRLRPVLREIAAHRLSTLRAVDLDGDPEAARALLSPEAWELVRADRPAPENRLGRGRPLAELRRAVDSLEAL